MSGRSPLRGSGHSAEPEPQEGLGHSASGPNAAFVVGCILARRDSPYEVRLSLSVIYTESEPLAIGAVMSRLAKEHPDEYVQQWLALPASAMSASGQDPEEGLEAKPASAIGEAETPNV